MDEIENAQPAKTEKKESDKKTKKKPWLWASIILLVGALALGSMTYLLDVYHNQMLEERKEEVKEAVNDAAKVVQTFYEKSQKGILTEEAAKNYALQTLRNVRHHTTEYYWVQDKDAAIIMHAIKPELEGKRIENIIDANGLVLFRAFAKAAEPGETGYVQYVWEKPGDTSGKTYPKISYLKKVEPWGWIIGSGMYVDDIEAPFRQAMYVTIALGLAIVFLMLILIFTMYEDFGE